MAVEPAAPSSIPPPTATAPASSAPADETELSREYETPMGLAHTTMQALKDRIKLHYDLASDYYLKLWGEHIHHGYWPTDESKATEPKDVAQLNLVRLLVSLSRLTPGATVLDVGCGLGGTSRFLASKLGCTVTGITISSRQVEIATRLSKADAAKDTPGTLGADEPDPDGFIALGKGRVKFVELDADHMADYFADGTAFDVVWISEALAHFGNKTLFFTNAHRVLVPGGTLAFADWAKADGLTETQFNNDIKPIEDGMLMPPLCTLDEYVKHGTDGGLSVLEGPRDISADVSKTWDITWSLVQSPSLWAFAFSQGRDGIAFLQAFRAMRRGYANGTLQYVVMSLQKK